jgi:nucleoside-diphosphate-sugar epimerase
VQAVIHTAGRAHTFDRGGAASLAGYRIVNTAGTLNLAEQVAAASIPRLVFLSSIGVNGAETSGGRPFTEDDEPQPHSDYARSKWEAEQGLLELAAKSGLEVVIVRPPLVYGFGAPGNFGTILRAMRRGWPLPLGAIHNKRSFVALENLVDFLLTCAVHPLAAHETFLVSDDQDLSTTEFVRAIALANGRSPRLLPIPVSVLRVGALALGRAHLLDRLVCNLQVSVAKARRVLNWTPPFSLTQALSRTLSPDAKSPPDGLAHR